MVVCAMNVLARKTDVLPVVPVLPFVKITSKKNVHDSTSHLMFVMVATVSAHVLWKSASTKPDMPRTNTNWSEVNHAQVSILQKMS